MKSVYLNLLGFLLLSSFTVPLQTDSAIFLFDNGDKNIVASMLQYARHQDASLLDQLNFHIVFMGASVDAMTQEPFCHYPDKMIHYKQLGIEETIDHTWKRDRKLTTSSMETLSKNFQVQKKVWVAVSSSIFEQIVQHYQEDPLIDVVAFRDNPSPEGDTDYFTVADQVQSIAHKVIVPSTMAAEKLNPTTQEIVVAGHPPIEEWCTTAKSLDKNEIIQRLGLNLELPIIVYAGVYGDFYESCFNLFLDLIPEVPMQVLIVPHPRYKGIVEKKRCMNLSNTIATFRIVGEFETEPSKKLKTIEALSIADVVVTADATSTIVFQACALGKKVFHVNPLPSQVSEKLYAKQIIQRLNSKDDFLNLIESSPEKETISDPFEFLGIPKNGAKLLWEEFR